MSKIDYDSIKNAMPGQVSGIVDDLLKQQQSKVNVGQAYKPSMPIRSKSGNTQNTSKTIGGEGTNLDGVGGIAGGLGMLSLIPRKGKDGKYYVGWGKGKKSYDTKDEAVAEREHQINLSKNPYSEKMSDGSYVYGETEKEFKKNKENYLKAERANKENLEIQSIIEETGYSEDRAKRVYNYTSSDPDFLVQEINKLDNTIAEGNLSPGTVEVLNAKKEDYARALGIVNKKLSKSNELTNKPIDVHSLDPKKTDPDQVISVHGQTMKYSEWQEKLEKQQENIVKKIEEKDVNSEEEIEEKIEEKTPGFFSKEKREERQKSRQERRKARKDRRTKAREDRKTKRTKSKEDRRKRRQDRKEERRKASSDPELTPFKTAFKQAREAGKEFFNWNGKKYHTKFKEEM